jgi:RNA polymerase sigma-70 factor (ECF subfamily)
MKTEEILKEYSTGLKYFLRSKISNEQDVEELLQEVLIKSLNSFDSLNSQKSLKSWLYTIAKNTVIDFYRKNAKFKELEFFEEHYGESEEDETNSEFLSKCITPMINSLPEEQRSILKAIDLEGISQKEFASSNNINYSTLKSKVQASRSLLKGTFEKCCDFTQNKQGSIVDFEEKSVTCKKC